MSDPDVTQRIWTMADRLNPCMFVTCDGDGQRIRPVYARVRRDEGVIYVLTDIQGMEDALGDMDFKVAGTRDGVTAIQMDIKVKGITTEIMRRALSQAHDGRQFILGARYAF